MQRTTSLLSFLKTKLAITTERLNHCVPTHHDSHIFIPHLNVKALLSRNHYGLLLVLCLSLGACKSLPTQPVAPISTMQLPNSAEASLARASESSSPYAEQLTLHAIGLLLEQQRIDEAQVQIESLYYSDLSNILKGDYLIFQSRIYIAQQNPVRVIDLLSNNTLGLNEFFDTLDLQQQIQLLNLRATAHELLENYLTAARERIFFASLLDNSDEIQANNEAIWRDLMTLPSEDLTQMSYVPGNADFSGWAELAAINKSEQDDLDLQVSRLNDWRIRWNQHPANTHLPSALQALVQAAAEQPKQLAILLPDHGKFKGAAEIIRNGFMSAYYSAREAGLKTPALRFYDSYSKDILTLHQQAIIDGAELIIGPLEKENVRRLAQQPNLAVKTLALNYLEGAIETPAELFQFGLAAEDEVEQVVKRALLQGYQNAAVIYPDTEWGHRIRSSFVESWQAQQGNVVAEVALESEQELSTPIKLMLNLDASEERKKRLQYLFKEKIQFEPRRRKDIDFILLLANPDQGRQIKPTLSFHYAHNLPLFATSHIYDAKSQPELDKDLNGVQFVETPWVMDNTNPIKVNSEQAWQNLSGMLARLHAMGVDAFRIYPRLGILQAMDEGSVNGATGVLTLNSSNRIQRQLLWAKIRKGTAEILPIIVEAGATDTSNRNQVEQLAEPE